MGSRVNPFNISIKPYHSLCISHAIVLSLAITHDKSAMENDAIKEAGNESESITTLNVISNEFPEKPVEAQKQQSINRSLISMVLFIVIFYIVFKWDLTYILVLSGVRLIHEKGHAKLSSKEDDFIEADEIIISTI